VRIAICLIAGTLGGCAAAIQSGPIIDSYNRARCVAPKQSLVMREWDDEIRLRNDTRVRVSGARSFSGAVRVTYQADGREVIAAKVGDYYYPLDIRCDDTREHLYVRTEGCSPLANTPFGGCNVTLFEFDLNQREQLRRQRVAGASLTEICP
jgi:hypothetical protein